MNRNLFAVLVLVLLVSAFIACGPDYQVQYSLYAQVQGEGSVYPNQGIYQANALIAFRLEPGEGWAFSHWAGRDGGQVVSGGGKHEVLIDKDLSILAVFEQSPSQNYQLDIRIIGNGQVQQIQANLFSKQGHYPSGTEVNLIAQADVGWVFKQWQGDLTGSLPQAKIVMDGPKNVLALFEEAQKQLTINIIGSGIVDERLLNSLEPLTSYPENSLVRLQALPARGWLFQEWRGDLRSTDPFVVIKLDSDKNLTAVFVEMGKNLDIAIQGQGRVEQKIITASEEYPAGSVVRLWAQPDNGWTFKEWRGDIRTKDSIVYVEMDEDKRITAVFEALSFKLEIEIEGKGRIDQRQISQDLADYPMDSVVRLTARPDSGWVFKEWRGDARGTKNVIEIEMDDDKYVTAVFEEEAEARYTLDVNVSGNGRVTKSPDSRDYEEGTEVTLKATADSGWRFKEWRSDASGTNSEVKVIMNGNKDVEAVFEKQASSGTGEVSGQIKISYSWPVSYSTPSSKANKEKIGKIPVLQDFGPKNSPQENYIPGQLIVGFEPFTIQNEQLEILEGAGVTVLDNISLLDAYLIEIPKEEMQVQMTSLAQKSGVAYVEPNYRTHLCGQVLENIKEPNDSYYKVQWHYRQLRLPEAWKVTTGSPNLKIAVLDTGIAANHPDLKNRVDVNLGYNFIDNNTSTGDIYGHGTHCAGTVGAETNNQLGVAGITWEGTIIPVKVYDDQGGGSYFNFAQGILFASGLLTDNPRSQKAHVLSMSLGGYENDNTMKNAVQRAYQAGVVMVAAAGNDQRGLLYPAALPEVIAVGAVDYNYPNPPKKSYYSNFGPEMDVVTPGGDTRVDSDGDGNVDGIMSTNINKSRELVYEFLQGTSMACPHGAGVAALMVANGIPPREVKEVMTRTASDLGDPGFDHYFGHGHVNAYWAVCDVKEIKILVGTRNGNRIDAVKESKVDLKSKTFELKDIPAGEYQVFAWIDVQNTGTIDPGDHLYESEKMTFSDGQRLQVNVDLKEVK